ncbi:HORMA domain-containing protein 1 isoform X1 [Pleurodeles waltl]|uniref:HORMA domain-containing protein 1 isoform X1 n=1 Tax=Pleurodeles waltl TaxID=8319 RepID=UPI003709838D
MATAQMQRNAVSAVTFPSKVSTHQQSLVLVKRLLAVSVSCITYLRGLFPECAYGSRYLDGLCIKILREDKSSPGSTQLVKWMLGCYDALQKKYLRMVVLAIYTNPEDPQTITECYQFKFRYTSSGPVMDFSSNNKRDTSVTCTDLKKSSILLIRKLYILMQNLGPLPNNVCLTMKLFYFDEVTPPDYQPPGFKEGNAEGMMFEGEPMHLNVGEVATPFHVLKVKVTTERERMENLEKTILKEGHQVQAIDLDKEDLEGQDNQMNEDVSSEFKLEEMTKGTEDFKLEEPSLACEEDVTMKSEESHKSSDSECHLQVDQLVNKTSQLEVSGTKTRSGKIIQNMVDATEAPKSETKTTFKENRKRTRSSKSIQNLDIPCSQDEEPVVKRKKFSEPKDPY